MGVSLAICQTNFFRHYLILFNYETVGDVFAFDKELFLAVTIMEVYQGLLSMVFA